MPPRIPIPQPTSVATRPPPALKLSRWTAASRGFATTAGRQAIKIPPESPRYINLPGQRQAEVQKKLPRKGHLPVPRDIFHPTYGRRKLDPAYLDKTAPLSLAEQQGEQPRSEHEAWKRVMADSRRQSLSAGLQGLWARKQARKGRERTIAKRNFEENRTAALFTPERAEDVLTRPTVRDSTAKITSVERDPDRLRRAAESAARTAAVAQFKKDSRRDALVELYVASADFIVDEAELEETIEKLFTKDHFHLMGLPAGNLYPENIWEARGMPHTVFSLMGTQTRSGRQVGENFSPDMHRTANRQKALSEALTGGKIPS